MTRLAELTTTGIGGEASDLREPADRDALVAVAAEAFAAETEEAPVLILGGGSNLLVSDEPVPGPVIRVATRGIELGAADADGRVLVIAEAGESWSGLVDFAVERGLAGIEALAGIPGTVGAAPVQNIGAYGQELSSVLTRIEHLDAETGEVSWLSAEELELGYRTSRLKRGELRGVVTRVELALRASGAGAGDETGAGTGAGAGNEAGAGVGACAGDEAGAGVGAGAGELGDGGRGGLGEPVAYGQLASALGVELGARVPLAEVRDAVVRLRAAKGMVLDADDPDTRSSGSFFTNPVISRESARELPAEAPRYPAPDGEDGTKLVKLSAAWLIEHSGVRKGFALPGAKAAISSKHSLAITNRGGASAEEVAELARYVQARVRSEFGVDLRPEPVVIGLTI